LAGGVDDLAAAGSPSRHASRTAFRPTF
jgi:hypothetical protein